MDLWLSARSDDHVVRRDVAANPPAPVDEAWIDAAFTDKVRRSPRQTARLAESEELTQERLAADALVGVPMYNFGVPSPLNAWIDNIVRVGPTFGFDRTREGEPYWPMVSPDKRLMILTACGDYGYAPGGRLAVMNVVEAGPTVPPRHIGITTSDTIAIEYDEFGDALLAASIAAAEAAVDALVADITRRSNVTAASPPRA